MKLIARYEYYKESACMIEEQFGRFILSKYYDQLESDYAQLEAEVNLYKSVFGEAEAFRNRVKETTDKQHLEQLISNEAWRRYKDKIVEIEAEAKLLRDAAKDLLDSAKDQKPKDGMYRVHNDFMLGLETALYPLREVKP